MTPEQIQTIRHALRDAIAADLDGSPQREYQQLLRQLERTVWVLEIWKGGELWNSFSSADPDTVLARAAAHVSDGVDVPADATGVEAFELVRERWEEMDITFTRVVQEVGGIVVLDQQHAEDVLVSAANQAA